MPRVRRCSCPLPVLCLIGLAFWSAAALADCRYDEESHEEGSEVATAEPCLNCTCSRGALLCYLRICPRLPNPPPPGCILLHRYKTCCPELICTEIGGGNSIEARSDLLDELEAPQDRTTLDHACVANGSIYAPGSAMDSSSFCEYCFCLAGRQTCVKPKCLLPLEGCTPIYDPSSCCPVHYNCTYAPVLSSTTTTTTLKPHEPQRHSGGCTVDGEHYPEGGKVLGVGHSVCDNCYCLRGILRCEPLSCAPPLLGCSPVVRQGECCAASYNCSGTIEIQPEPNYGHFPIVSKEYAKLRKQVQRLQPTTENPNLPFYVIAETPPTQYTTKVQRSPSFGTTRHFNGSPSSASTAKPHQNHLVNDNNFATTNQEVTTNEPGTYSTTEDPIEDKLRSGDYLGLNDDTLLSIVDSLLDYRLNRRVENKTEETTITFEETTETSTYSSTVEPIEDSTTFTILNSTDCIDGTTLPMEESKTTVLPIDANEINKLEETKRFEITTSEEVLLETTTNEDVTEVDLESRVKVAGATVRSIPKIPPEVEAILNITKEKNQDYEYDYNESSLPPSLPNLRIIPFVAADALDTKKDKHSAVYIPQEKRTDPSFTYSNLFSPPVETEGGFVPKETLDNFYENAVTAPSITSTSRVSCVYDGRDISHGESVPSEAPCITCACYYGNIVCQNVQCPGLRKNCRKTAQDSKLCCPPYICDDGKETTAGDPFFIRTKPQSLRKTTPLTTTESNSFGLDKVLQLIFSNGEEKLENDRTVAPSTRTTLKLGTSTVAYTEIETRENSNDSLHPNSVDSPVNGLAILKLAGCNIYGRMYRVGRIISELSNPCLECKCTEIGVQCRALQC